MKLTSLIKRLKNALRLKRNSHEKSTLQDVDEVLGEDVTEQDHKRAIILGTQSFGKGSVQTIVPLSKDIAMRLTTARYYTPSGKSIQKTGISPDIVVNAAKIERNLATNQRREADLRGALENTDKEKQSDKADTSKSRRPTAKELANKDYQLARAVDLLRGLSLLEKRTVN